MFIRQDPPIVSPNHLAFSGDIQLELAAGLLLQLALYTRAMAEPFCELEPETESEKAFVRKASPDAGLWVRDGLIPWAWRRGFRPL